MLVIQFVDLFDIWMSISPQTEFRTFKVLALDHLNRESQIIGTLLSQNSLMIEIMLLDKLIKRFFKDEIVLHILLHHLLSCSGVAFSPSREHVVSF